MTDLEVLRQRRMLVLTSARLQRATIVRRLDRIEMHPARIALGIAARAASVPLAWKLGSRAVALAVRMYRRRSSGLRHHATT